MLYQIKMSDWFLEHPHPVFYIILGHRKMQSWNSTSVSIKWFQYVFKILVSGVKQMDHGEWMQQIITQAISQHLCLRIKVTEWTAQIYNSWISCQPKNHNLAWVIMRHQKESMVIIYPSNCYINGNTVRKLAEHLDNLIHNVSKKPYNDLGEIMNAR